MYIYIYITNSVCVLRTRHSRGVVNSVFGSFSHDIRDPRLCLWLMCAAWCASHYTYVADDRRTTHLDVEMAPKNMSTYVVSARTMGDICLGENQVYNIAEYVIKWSLLVKLCRVIIDVISIEVSSQWNYTPICT